MAKRSTSGSGGGDNDVAPERDFAERFAVTAESLGMPRMVGRLLGWLLVCDPPVQSSQELENALGVSRASINIGVRFLEATHLVTRRTRPGDRNHYFELDPRVFIRLADAERYRAFRLALEECLELRPGDTSPRAERLRDTHDFYAYMEREVELLIQRYPGRQAKS